MQRGSTRLPVRLLLFFLPPLCCAATAPAPPQTALELAGTGVQIYTCLAAPTGFVWKLKAPDATLSDDDGTVLGHHSAGPTWQATDGSKVVGEKIAANPAPTANAVPWLLLRAASTEGQGVFSHVAFITRTRTRGGVAPQAGCDASHLDAEARVPYSASYTFFLDTK